MIYLDYKNKYRKARNSGPPPVRAGSKNLRGGATISCFTIILLL